MYDIRHYIDIDGRDHFAIWRNGLKDNIAKIAVDRRIIRLELGNFGDHKPLRDGVWELRIDSGPGYRIYYAKDGETLILLLCGGDKRKQNADIERAISYLNDWKQRKGD